MTSTKRDQARAAAIKTIRADAERVRRLNDQLADAREQLDATLATAVGSVGMSVTHTAEEASLSRESVYQALRRHDVAAND